MWPVWGTLPMVGARYLVWSIGGGLVFLFDVEVFSEISCEVGHQAVRTQA